MIKLFSCVLHFPHFFLVYYYLPSELCMGRTSYCYDLKSDPYRNSHSPRTTGGFLFTVSQRELTTSVREAKLTVPVSGQNRGRCGVISLLHPVSPPSLTTPSLLYPLTTHSGIKYYVKQNVILPHSKFFKVFLF